MSQHFLNFSFFFNFYKMATFRLSRFLRWTGGRIFHKQRKTNCGVFAVAQAAGGSFPSYGRLKKKNWIQV